MGRSLGMRPITAWLDSILPRFFFFTSSCPPFFIYELGCDQATSWFLWIPSLVRRRVHRVSATTLRATCVGYPAAVSNAPHNQKQTDFTQLIGFYRVRWLFNEFWGVFFLFQRALPGWICIYVYICVCVCVIFLYRTEPDEVGRPVCVDWPAGRSSRGRREMACRVLMRSGTRSWRVRRSAPSFLPHHRRPSLDRYPEPFPTPPLIRKTNRNEQEKRQPSRLLSKKNAPSSKSISLIDTNRVYWYQHRFGIKNTTPSIVFLDFHLLS